MKCSNCGNDLQGKKFCSQCGAAAPVYEAPVPPPIPPKYVTEANLPPAYRPLSPWAYFGLTLLFSLPLVGFILLIVFSFDDSNIHRRNYARSYWCSLVLVVAVTILMVVLFLATGLSTVILDELQHVL